MKNLITDKPSPITVALAQKLAAAKAMAQTEKSKAAAGVPVLVDPLIMKNTEADADLKLKMLVGPDEVSVAKNAKKPATFAELEESSDEDEDEELVQLDSWNPVNNPPFNNWSVNQPSVPHDHGLNGREDLGQNIIVDGHAIHYSQIHSNGLNS